jgi:hypothetical protein
MRFGFSIDKSPPLYSFTAPFKGVDLRRYINFEMLQRLQNRRPELVSQLFSLWKDRNGIPGY